MINNIFFVFLSKYIIMAFTPPTGLTTVQQLNRSVLHGTILNDIVREQLLIIDKKVINFNKHLGENQLMYELPVTFLNVQADRTDTRIMVYYHVIKDLERRGYKATIKLSESKATLTINWVIGLDTNDLQNMESFLQSKSVD